MQTLDVVEIIKKAESGITEPYLCRLSDDREYYVKGRSATPKGLMAELVCARLGRAFGLPIPEFTLAKATPGLLDKFTSSSLGTGVLFASLRQGGAVPISTSSIVRVGQSEQQKLFVFDAWIRNEDRTQTEFGGNPNYFLSAETGLPFVIDHNLAFDPNFDLSKNLSLHVCSAAWAAAKLNLVTISSLRAEVGQLLLKVEDLRYDVPEEWLDSRPMIVEEFIETLLVADHDEFWDSLSG